MAYEVMFRKVRSLSDSEFENMLQSLRLYGQSVSGGLTSLFFLNTEQLRTIPWEIMAGLMPNDVKLISHKLPAEYKTPLLQYERCSDHYNFSQVDDVGPVPLRKDCPRCSKFGLEDVSNVHTKG